MGVKGPMRFLVLLLWLALLFVPASARADAPLNCNTPRAAADMLFYWQQPATTDLHKAIRCLERAGRSDAELRDLARRAKRAFDSRALFVDMTALSDQPDFVDERGEAVVTVHPELEAVVLERKRDGRWLWTAESLDHILALADSDLPWLESLVSRLPASAHGRVFGVMVWQYLGLGLLFVVALVLRAIVRMVIENRVRRWAEALGQRWASHVASLVGGPLATFVMALVMRVSFPALGLPIQAGVVVALAIRIVMVLAVVWLLYRLVDLLAERMADRAADTDTKLDDQLVPLVRKSLKILVIVGGVLFVLQNLDVDVGSLLTGLGIGGLAFALAAKETLANFFGSIMIFIDRPFQIGDWIVVKGAEGIVEEVGFRSTRVRTFYNSVITVPNAHFTDAQIDNYGRRQYRRVFTTLNLTYDTTPEQMQAFCQGIRAIIRANEYTRKDYYEVHMSAFGAHSLDVMVYFFFRVPSWSDELRERHNVFLEIMRLAKALGVQFAFPTQTLNLDYVHPPGQPRHLPDAPNDRSLADHVLAFGPRGSKARPHGPTIVEGGFSAGATEGADDN